MNKKLTVIFQRRSVRRFESEPAPDAVIRDLLEAAMAAPSAVCKDPWRFVVARQRATLEALAAGLPNGAFLPQAGAALIVCGEPAAAHDRQLSYLLQDCSAAIENALLAASALGWGACWLGVHPREERVAHVRAVLGLPPNVLPIAVLALGRPADAPAARTRYDDAKVHWEKW